MPTYKYTNATNTVVHVIDEDGISRKSMSAAALLEKIPDVVIIPADPPTAEEVAQQARTAADAAEAAADKLDAQLVATLDMTDAEISNAINGAFTDPAQRTIVKRLARLAIHSARGRVLR